MDNQKSKPKITYIILQLLIVAVAGYLAFDNYSKRNEIKILSENKTILLQENSLKSNSLLALEQNSGQTITVLNESLLAMTKDLQDLENDYRQEKDKNDNFADQIREISGTVSILDKLSKTDEELLQKYSRTYFLNENFVPLKLSEINSKYILPGKKDQYFHGDALDFLTDMIDDANDDGFDLKVVSAYRSFAEQKDLKGQFTQTYGISANTFSADQGFSEHQLGTAVDLTNPAVGGAFSSFANTADYRWLLKNAYKYGFVLSYPENNSFYIFEPWHWRFVGRYLAFDLNRKGVSLYDLTQRELDKYLVSIFD